jgi:cytochrome c553
MGLRRILVSALVAGICSVATTGVLAQDLARGEDLFDLCAQCHGAEGAGNAQYLAPAIAGMPDWYLSAQVRKFRDGIRGAHFDDISGMRMRPMARALRTDEDLEAVVAYVAGLPKIDPEPTLTGGDAGRGAALYAPCIACHGVAGEGMQPLNGPPLAEQSDWYMLEQLKKFKSGARGSNPQDTYGILMRPMALGLADDQAMLDVIAHIETLGR